MTPIWIESCSTHARTTTRCFRLRVGRHRERSINANRVLTQSKASQRCVDSVQGADVDPYPKHHRLPVQPGNDDADAHLMVALRARANIQRTRTCHGNSCTHCRAREPTPSTV